MPWQDRWTQPKIEQLLEPLNPQHHKALTNLMAGLEAYEHMHRRLVWHGDGWCWTVQYDLKDPDGNDLGTFCYVVPRAESPLVAESPLGGFPLPTQLFARLPIRRLHKYLRTTVRSAKRIFNVYWATWALTANSEQEHLMDLAKRKYKILTEPIKPDNVKTKK